MLVKSAKSAKTRDRLDRFLDGRQANIKPIEEKQKLGLSFMGWAKAKQMGLI